MNGTTVQENRLRKFAGFFKGYMGVMPLVTAAVAPLLTMMKAIPVFESQKSTLATYSGLLGFLLLAWVFYARRAFAVAMVHSATIPFGEPGFGVQALKRISANMLPLVLIAGSILSYIAYFTALDEAINKARFAQRYADIVNRQDVLEKWGQRESIFQSSYLQAFFKRTISVFFSVLNLRSLSWLFANTPMVSSAFQKRMSWAGTIRSRLDDGKATPRNENRALLEYQRTPQRSACCTVR